MGATRKRSAAITLVLAGGAALSGCSEPEAQRDVYTKVDDCAKDWGRPEQCERVADGRQSSSYFYGPPYFGPRFPSGKPRPSANALEAVSAGRGGATRIARAGAGSGPSSAGRSGFGSSGRAASSSGG